jgi:hypothetical protein
MAALASRIVPGPCVAAIVLAACLTADVGALGQAADDAFLAWSRRDATGIVANMRRTDSVGSRLSFRGLKTDRAINYKLRATWLTPDVIRATARAIQLDERLSPADTRRLIAEAEGAADTVFFVEIDPTKARVSSRSTGRRSCSRVASRAARRAPPTASWPPSCATSGPSAACSSVTTPTTRSGYRSGSARKSEPGCSGRVSPTSS